MLAFSYFMLSLLNTTEGAITGFIHSYGYVAIFVLMALESASLPIPSEVVLPLVGLFSAQGVINPYLAFIVVFVAGLLGMAIDYYIGYYVGKEVIYKHLRAFRVKKETLDAFDAWFSKNGAFAVFVGRLLPEVRGLVSLPAGFAVMPKRKFFFYSAIGTLIWDIVLMSFGYYALDSGSAYVTLIAVGLLATILYAIYALAMSRVIKRR